MPSILNATTNSGLVTSADNSGSLQLATNNGTTAVTIDTSQNVSTAGNTNLLANGNVGIGTSSPTSALQVSRSGAVSVTVSSTGGGGNWEFGADAGGNGYIYSGQSKYLALSTSGSERMRITSGGNMVFANRSGGGNVGQLQVGLTSVLGSINAYGQFGGDSGTPYPLGVKGNSSSQGMVGFFDSADSVIGSISKSGSNVAYNTSSDYRLKENIAPMTGALDVVQQLKPVTYTWKIDGSAGQGFIAHELQAVVPDAVTGEKDAVNEDGSIKPQGVDTSFLVATLTAAIQEQQAQIEQLKAEVQALKGAA